MTYQIEKSGDYLHGLRIRYQDVQLKNGKWGIEVHMGGIGLGPHVYLHRWGLCAYEIWHVPAHKAWDGIGSQSSEPATYYLVGMWIDKDGTRRADILYEVRPGKQWRKAVQDLINLTDRITEDDDYLHEQTQE